MLHNIGSPYRTPAVRFFQRKNARNKKRKKGSIEEKERERRSSGRRRRLKYFRGSRGRAIIEKGFHLTSILAGKKCRSRAGEVSSFHRELICSHRSFVLPEFHPLLLLLYKIDGRLSSRKITSLCVVFVDVYGERNNARAHIGQSRGATTSSSRVRIYGTKIATAARKLSF